MTKIIMLIVGATALYSLGAITVQYKLFPYSQIVKLKHIDKVEPNYLNNKKYEKWINLYNIYENKKVEFVMLGDSITFGVNWNELLGKNNILNRGIDADTTKGFIHRLDNIYKINPKYVFIMGGINDITKEYDVDIIFNNYKTIIKGLQDKDIIPVVQSTLFTREQKHIEKVEILNNLLFTYCKNNKIDFINLNTKLSKNSMLIEDYTYDGIHLNANAYKIWKGMIQHYFINHIFVS